MDTSQPISQLMITDVVTATPNQTMKEIEQLFDAEHINHLPICEDDHLVGIISRVDYHKLLHSFTVFNTKESQRQNEQILSHLLAGEIMHKQVETISPTTTVAEAAAIFGRRSFHALPVVDAEQRIVGIVTVMDLFRHAYQL